MNPDSNSDDDREAVKAIVQAASPDAQKILNEVLELEKAKLHMKMPSGIAEDIVSRVKALIK